MNSGAEGDIIIDGHRQREGPLGKKTYLLPQRENVRLRVVNILVIYEDFPFDRDLIVQVDQSVQALEKCGLSASGGANDRGNLPIGYINGYLLYRLMIAVGGRQFSYADMGHSNLPHDVSGESQTQ